MKARVKGSSRAAQLTTPSFHRIFAARRDSIATAAPLRRCPPGASGGEVSMPNMRRTCPRAAQQSSRRVASRHLTSEEFCSPH